MRLPRLSDGVIRDRFAVVGRELGGVAPRGPVKVCGDSCLGAIKAEEVCPSNCPCAYQNGSWSCYMT